MCDVFFEFMCCDVVDVNADRLQQGGDRDGRQQTEFMISQLDQIGREIRIQITHH